MSTVEILKNAVIITSNIGKNVSILKYKDIYLVQISGDLLYIYIKTAPSNPIYICVSHPKEEMEKIISAIRNYHN
jgi:hypothetical protein